MTRAPDPAEVARLVALAEEGLRSRGFGERAIQRARRANRALIEAHLEGGGQDPTVPTGADRCGPSARTEIDPKPKSSPLPYGETCLERTTDD